MLADDPLDCVALDALAAVENTALLSFLEQR